MGKEEMISGILGAIYLVLLIIYMMASSNFTLILNFVLLILAFIIAILMISRVTKSSNSLKAKIFFSILFSFFVFFLIVFFWFLGDHENIDEKGFATLITISLASIFLLISFITGLILSIKRKDRKDFTYNLKPIFWIFSILLIILLLIFFYNPLIRNLAKISGNENICYSTVSLMFSHSYESERGGSYMFSRFAEPFCLSEVGILKNDEAICDRVCSSFRVGKSLTPCKGIQSRCYSRVSVSTGDIKNCFDSSGNVRADMTSCGITFIEMEDEIYEILQNPSHSDIIYAIKTTPNLGIYYDPIAEGKYIPIMKNLVQVGSLEVKREALEILFTWASQDSLEEEKEVIRNEILPLIEDNSELSDYIDRANRRLSAVVIEGTLSGAQTIED